MSARLRATDRAGESAVRAVPRGRVEVRRAAWFATGAVIAAVVWLAHELGAHVGEQVATERARTNAGVLLGLEAWQEALAADADLLARTASEARDRLRAAVLELGRGQARVVMLEALAARLVDDNDLGGNEFDFDAAPSLGGLEQARPLDGLRGTAERASELAVAFERFARRLEDEWIDLHVLERLLESRSLADYVLPKGRPVATAYVSSPFGERVDPFSGRTAVHDGVDFAGPRGAPVVAVAPGLVTWAGPRGGYGRMVEIDHGDVITRYAHNSANVVSVGDVVERGQTIARLGATGRATGPNLHFEVLRGGRAVDPLEFTE